MAVILRDPLVEDHIREVSLGDDDGCAPVRALYEDGHLVILRDFRFDLDYAFINALNFNVDAPPEIQRKIKKYDSARLERISADSGDPMDRLVISEVFAGDAGRLRYFQEQIRSGNAQADALYRRIFPAYTAYRQVRTWRMTTTALENLHWDNFHLQDIFQQVRIFCNLATSRRLWRLSHRIETYAASTYREGGLARFADQVGDALNNELNSRMLGGVEAACLDRLPTHHVMFEQGDVWLCETRIVSHQIYYGEQAFATMYFSDPATMDDPGRLFDARIAALHQRHGAGSGSQAG